MWYRTRALAGPVFLASLAAGCGSAGESVAGPDLRKEAAVTSPVTLAVTGSGHYTAAEGQWRTFSFTVRQMPDGTVQGRFAGTAHLPDGGVNHWAGPLTCVVVDGTEAWFGGVYERATNPALVGTGFTVKVEDNGEGRRADPDMISRAMRGGSDCTLRPTPNPEFYYQVEAGNIQIHR
jgi:hypothetical protein